MLREWIIHLNWRIVVDLGYHLLVYILLIYSIFRISKSFWTQKINQTIRTKRMPSLSVEVIESQKKNAVNKHLELLLVSTKKKYTDFTLYQFYIVVLSAGSLTFTTFYRLTGGVKGSLIFAFFSMWIPYVWLWVKLTRNRAVASHDLLPATNLLLQKYRSNHSNMYYAIMELVKELEGPIQHAFYSILNTIQSRREVEEAIKLFHYQINTTWSLQLTILMLGALKEDKLVDNGLSRIVKDMTETTIIMEKEQSENRDTIQLGYFPIFAIPITILMNQQLMDGKAFHYYFQTHDGLAVLMVTILICTFSFFVSMIYSKPKHDI